MNAHVIRISGSAWGDRKKGSVKLVIEVRPETQAQWVEALEMFKQRPELSVTVVAPKVSDPAPKPGYDAIGPKADVDCPEPECGLQLGHTGEHVNAYSVTVPDDCPKPDCNLLAGHKGKCVKKVAK